MSKRKNQPRRLDPSQAEEKSWSLEDVEWIVEEIKPFHEEAEAQLAESYYSPQKKKTYYYSRITFTRK